MVYRLSFSEYSVFPTFRTSRKIRQDSSIPETRFYDIYWVEGVIKVFNGGEVELRKIR